MAFALGITLWLTWQTHHQETQSVKPIMAMYKTKSIITDQGTQLDDYTLASRSLPNENINDVFSVPKKTIVKKHDINQPAKPTPPPLPFKYLGLVEESSINKLILDYQGNVLALKEGDTVGQTYKLSAVTKIGNSIQLQFLYLPMNITQLMVVSDEK